MHPRLAPIALDFSKPLAPRALAVIAVLVNPDLQALRAREAVASAQVFAAGLLPDPHLSGGVDHPIGAPGGVAGLVNAYNVALEWAVSSLITRPANARIARETAEQVRLDVAWHEWLVANQARLLARRVSYLEQRQAVADQAARTAGEILDVTRRALRRGDTTIDRLGLREVAYLDATDRALALARQGDKARHDLNGVLGLPPAERVAIAAARVPLRAPAASGEQLFASARRERLDLAALRAGYGAQEARVRAAVLGQYPRFGLGLGTARDTSAVMTLGVSVSIDLPILNRNRGAIAVAEATRGQLYREYAARLHATRAEIATLVADLRRIAAEHAALDRELPELRAAAKRLRDAAARGDVLLSTYEAVRSSLLDKELTALALEQAAAEQQVALDIAAGGPLAP